MEDRYIIVDDKDSPFKSEFIALRSLANPYAWTLVSYSHLGGLWGVWNVRIQAEDGRMKHAAGRIIRNDRLVIRWWNPKTKQMFSQGKRVGKDCLLTAAERRAYVKNGITAVIKMIRDRRNLSLQDTIELLYEAR